MPRFVLVVNEVPNVQFEKAFEVKNKAGDKVMFLPQGGKDQGVQSPGMVSTKLQQLQGKPAVDVMNHVRFEWGEDGAESGAEIVKILAGS
jgi:hypothetical protein